MLQPSHRSPLVTFTLLSALTATLPFVSIAQTTTPPAPSPASSPTSFIEKHIDESLAAMTLEEKISLLSGGSVLGSSPLARLGIPAFRMGDGPIGAHDPQPSTAFAAGIALTATWDRELAERIGVQIGRDSRSRGAAFLLGPGVNIYRTPLNGRNHEYFGEDPFLAAQIVVPYIKGVQSQNVTATVKHFVGNDSEFARFNSDSIMGERALREIYLPAFEAAVRQAHVGAIMDAYDHLNGVWMTDNAYLNTEIARKQWGFDGLIMSDWVATHDAIGAANGGLDLEMPAGLYFNNDMLIPAIKSGQVSVATIDEKIRRMLRLAARFGWITPDPAGPGWISHDPLDPTIPRYNQQGRQVALESALESATLLKNQGQLLPLDLTNSKNIAVIGPNALPGYATGGGSGMVAPFFVTGPFRGISDYLGVRGNVTYDQGISRPNALAAQTGLTVAADGAAPGVTVDVYSTSDFAGKPVSTRHEDAINAGPYAQIPSDPSDQPDIGITLPPNAMKQAMRESLEGNIKAPLQYTRYTGYYHAVSAGKYLVFVEHPAKYRLTIDGASVIDHSEIAKFAIAHTFIDLTAGAHKVVLDEYGVEAFVNGTTRLGIAREDALVHPTAIELARQADAVVVSVGFDTESEGEGADREFQLLPGQDELIRQVAAVNPHTIVVLNAGGSVDASRGLTRFPHSCTSGTPERKAALLWPASSSETPIPPAACPSVGSAKSPTTPPSLTTTPLPEPRASTMAKTSSSAIVAMSTTTPHRCFPLDSGSPTPPSTMPTSRSIPRHVPRSGTLAYQVEFDVTNTGPRAGADVAQLYLSEDHPAVARPAQELKGFARVELDPGQTRHIVLPLDTRSFAWYDVAAKAWHADAGSFTVHISRSSADPQLQGAIVLDRPVFLPVE